MSYGREYSGSGVPKGLKVGIGIVVGIVALIILMTILDSFFGYLMYRVDSTSVGIKFRASQPYQIVGPGVWTELGLWEDIKTIRIAGLPFRMADPEVLTKDQQRLGVEVSGTVHRPGVDQADIILTNWSNYSVFYTSDQALVGVEGDVNQPGLMQRLGQQACKVCVGDLPFNEAVVGSARDLLRECIDKELDKLAKGYGLEVRNVVVPNIELGAAVQQKLDDITNAKFQTLEAQQQELKAKAEAERELAVQQGQIRVEQGKIQEKAKQDAITAALSKQALEAQNAVIEAEKKNMLLAATRDLEIAKVNKAVQEENAKAGLAPELAKAAMYGSNPQYVDLLKVQAWSSAYGEMDKVFLPPNVSPFMMFGNSLPALTVPMTGTSQ